jgi:hypothetical protein
VQQALEGGLEFTLPSRYHNEEIARGEEKEHRDQKLQFYQTQTPKLTKGVT